MSAEDFAKKSYDYVICGGGTAGLVVAARLTEDPNVSVAVLEAGESRLDDLLVDAPNLFTQLWGKPEYDWSFNTVPQPGTQGKVHGWVRGKALGGSSAVNYNMYSMASRQDLDNWAELGNKGWGFDDMLPYYRKSETYNPSSEQLSVKINDKYLDPLLRGTSGPIQVSFCETETTWVQDVWPKTVLNAGYDAPKDPRTGSAIGAFNQLTTVDPKTMRRSYAARDYYEPNKSRPNFAVLTGALVTKINFEKDGADATATCVQFTVNGQTHTIKANKEVIVSGGVINSPQILEISGVGSPEVLKKVGIDVVVENPAVGEGLNDHSATGVMMKVKDEYPTAEVLSRNPALAEQAIGAYIQHKAGPFAAAPTASGFTSLKRVDPDLKEPEKHLQGFLSAYEKENPNYDPAGRDKILARQLLDPKEAVAQIVLLPTGGDLNKTHLPAQMFNHDVPGNFIILACCSTRSLSRGSVHITSADPTTYPEIDPAYFKHPLDLDVIARSILHVQKFAEVEPLKSVMARDADGNLIPHPQVGKLPTTVEEAKLLAQNATVTEYHPVGTCAMLPREKGGVVDDQLKVYGTKNVRVIDASIFPLHVQGNIVSLVYAIAEKGADLIKGKQSA